MASMFRIFGSIQKIEEQDDGTIEVHGIASAPTRDAVGELITAEAMKAALPDYSRFPALREMHQPSAAGKVLEAEVDDEGVTHIVAKVVDPVAIVKVRTGVYAGFSVGGKVLKRDPNDRTIITAMKLVEISLVDSPCNPDATLMMWKADLMSDFKPAGADVVAKAKDLAKAAGTQRFREFLFEASETLIAEQILKSQEAEEVEGEAPEAVAASAAGDAVTAIPPPAAEAAPEAAAAPAVEAETAVEATEPKEAAAPIDESAAAAPASEGEAAPADPAAALTAAIDKGNEIVAAAAPPAPEVPADPFADLGKAATALKGMKIKSEGEAVTKSLFHVSRMAELLSSFASLQSGVDAEADREGDNSPIPAMMADQIKAMGDCLVMCVKEEVAELVADMDDGAEDGPTIVFYDDYVEYGATIVDLVKADAALMEGAADRLAKRAPPPAEGEEDELAAKAARIEELEAEGERLAKALGDAAPAIEDMTKRFGETTDGLKAQIADLEKRFGELDQTPLPPKTAGPAATRVVEKGVDSAGQGDIAPGAALSAEQFEKAWAGLSEAERGNILVKVALAKPHAVAGLPAR